MTDLLRLNGISVPVADGSVELEGLDIGGMKRAEDGSPVINRRGVKGSWRYATPVKTAEESLAWRGLVTGRGHSLSFDAQSWYTSKGMSPNSVAGGWSFTTSSPKFGAAMAQWTTGNALWAFFSSASPWTLAWWLNQAAAGWHHYAQTSAGTKWIDGVLSPGGTMLGLGGVTAGVATFGSTTASKLDDLVALPYVVPDDWPAQMYEWGVAGNPFSALPVLTADGDMIELNTAVSVVGQQPKGRLFQAALSGWKQNLHTFAFELFEA